MEKEDDNDDNAVPTKSGRKSIPNRRKRQMQKFRVRKMQNEEEEEERRMHLSL